MQTTTLRPGLLVSLKTVISGGVSYNKRDIEPEHIEPDGSKKSVWETERTIEDPAEHEDAVKVRRRCRSLITGVCSNSSFGLLCPDNRIDDLDRAIKDAQELAYAYNSQAQLTRIGVYIVAGKIAADDMQAVRAINSEVRDLLDTVERGLVKLDVETVREAANRATKLGRMLSPLAQERVKEAVQAARGAARRIVKAAEQGAVEIDEATLRAVRASRTAFLDLSDAGEVLAPETEGRAIDLTPQVEDHESCPECGGEDTIRERTNPDTGEITGWVCTTEGCDWTGDRLPEASQAEVGASTSVPEIDLGAYAGDDDESQPAVPARTPMIEIED